MNMNMPAMPRMPRARASKPIRECACGCGGQTKATWTPGHDGRATGWATRAMAGRVGWDTIPTNEIRGAARMAHRMATRAIEAEQATAAA